MKDDISKEVKEILDWSFSVTEEKTKVPDKSDLTLGETAIKLETCALYVDMRGSSTFADTHRSTTAAKVYNAYLNAMVRVARSNYGRVRSFNGDSILVIFDPDMPSIVCDKAVKTAMEMTWVAKEIIRPAIKAKGYEEDFQIGVGVTKGTLLVTKAGLRGDPYNNDLIWPCTPVNLAAKLGDSAKEPYSIYISERVYNELGDNWKYTKGPFGTREEIWERVPYFQFAGSYITVYKTKYHATLS
ncbi:MAG: adenylate/guanylate cyclase domain-containing protein [Moorellales bacterium]